MFFQSGKNQLTTPTDRSAQIIALVCFVALGTPFLFGYGTIPLTNFAGEIVSMVGFAMMLMLATQYRQELRTGHSPRILQLLFLVLIVLVVAQYFYFGQHNGMAWLLLCGYLALAAMASWAGYAASGNGFSDNWLKGIALGLAFAGSIASAASFAQYFSIDGSLFIISPAAQPGRTFGFIRQPNHQATFLCLGLVSVLTLQRLIKPKSAGVMLAVLSPLLAFGVVSTGSRTALVELVFVAMYAVFFLRKEKLGYFKALYPIICTAVIWCILYYLNQVGGAEFYGSNKLEQTSTEGAGVRTQVWLQTWELIKAHPWLGAGLPYYSSIFFLSGAAASSGIIMTHSHNLALQLAFGLGIPFTLLFFVLLLTLLYRARKLTDTSGGFLTFSLIGCVLVHSQVEFPLWYTYFLLPFCFCIGWLSYRPAAPTPANAPNLASAAQNRKGAAVGWAQKMALASGAVTIGVATWMNHDFYKVTPMFSPNLVTQLSATEQDARQVFWFQSFVQYSVMSREKVTMANHSEYLARVSELACFVPEFWYQQNTLLALTFAGRLDEVRWILYSYTILARGNVDRFKSAFEEAKPPLGNEILAFLASPKPVPKAVQTFERACYSSKKV